MKTSFKILFTKTVHVNKLTCMSSFSKSGILTQRNHSTKSSTDVANPTIKKGDRKMTTLELLHLKRENKKISMITAYDYPSGLHPEV